MKDGFYWFGTKHGVFNRCFVCSQFSKCAEKLVDIESVLHVEKLLRELVKAHSLSGRQGALLDLTALENVQRKGVNAGRKDTSATVNATASYHAAIRVD